MSQYENNNFIHNLRKGVEMVQAGMSPALTSAAMAEVGINAPAALLEAAAVPGVVGSMGAKPFTHARAERHIAAHRILQEHLASMPVQSNESDDDVIDCVFVENDDEEADA